MNSEPESRTSDWLSSALERFEGRLVRYARRIVSNDEEARDIVQETFLKLCRQNPEELNGRLAQWLYTVCRNRALDVRRRRTHELAAPVARAVTPQSREQSPADVSEKRETVATVREEVSRLTQNQQECIRLKFEHELSYSEISAITGLSVSNVGFLIHTGLKTVRERLRRADAATGLGGARGIS
jgi:RNA polymerase sigma-70 factor (ECF subfamily)